MILSFLTSSINWKWLYFSGIRDYLTTDIPAKIPVSAEDSMDVISSRNFHWVHTQSETKEEKHRPNSIHSAPVPARTLEAPTHPHKHKHPRAQVRKRSVSVVSHIRQRLSKACRKHPLYTNTVGSVHHTLCAVSIPYTNAAGSVHHTLCAVSSKQ